MCVCVCVCVFFFSNWYHTVCALLQLAFKINSRYHNFFLIINLAAPGLSCGTWNLRSSLQHTGSGSLNPGLNPGPLYWELGVLPLDHQGSSCNLLLTINSVFWCSLILETQSCLILCKHSIEFESSCVPFSN